MSTSSQLMCVCVVVQTNGMLECSHMTSTNQSQPDAKFVMEEEEKKKEKEWLWFKSGIAINMWNLITQ